jgi:uncharacterized membrane protein YtjA (UPF0391 family)
LHAGGVGRFPRRVEGRQSGAGSFPEVLCLEAFRDLLATLRGDAMLHYAVVFLIIALIAAVFGFGGIAAGAAGIAKVLFVIFLIGAVVSFLMHGRSRV